MHSNIKTRLGALEKVTGDDKATCRVAQVVVYNPATGEPLVPLDPTAIRYIWIPDDGSGDLGPWR